MNDSATCKKCHGNKHILDPKLKVWVPCECLIRSRMDRAQSIAEIDPDYRNLFLESLEGRLANDSPKAWKRVSSIVASLEDMDAFSSKIICIISRYSPSLGDRISSVILNHSIKAGYSARTIELPDLVSTFMEKKGTKNSSLEDSILKSDALRIMCGFENKNKISGQYIYSLCQLRRTRGKATVLVFQKMNEGLIRETYGEAVLEMIKAPEQSVILEV